MASRRASDRGSRGENGRLEQPVLERSRGWCRSTARPLARSAGVRFAQVRRPGSVLAQSRSSGVAPGAGARSLSRYLIASLVCPSPK